MSKESLWRDIGRYLKVGWVCLIVVLLAWWPWLVIGFLIGSSVALMFILMPDPKEEIEDLDFDEQELDDTVVDV